MEVKFVDSTRTIADQSIQSLQDRTRALFDESLKVKRETIRAHCDTIVKMAQVIYGAYRNGHKLLLCGNGGSAADAQHMAAEMLIRLRPGVNRNGLPALALAADTSSLTACGNDYSFEGYYARMVQALGQPGDVLLAFSTSGRSPNIVEALSTARLRGLVTLGLLGGSGQPALAECDLALLVPSSTIGRIQETHVTVGHAMLELVEDLWLADGRDDPA
jgi:D-sedoheptulose 7-phosphate isomerase